MAAPSFEADLQAARESASISLETIQSETRVPADVVKRLETGELMQDPSFNEVYIRALLRSYATAVGLSPSAVLEAYNAARAGTYRGQLRPGFLDEPQPAPEPGAPDPPAAAVPDESNAPVRPDAQPEATPSPPPATPSAAPPSEAPAVAALSTPALAPSPTPKPQAETVETRRVTSKAAARAPRSFDRSWGAILGVTAVVIVAVVAVLWLLFRTDEPEPEVVEAVVEDSSATDFLTDDTTAVPAPADPQPAGTGPRFELPIRVTVRAEGDGLQNFRVTEEPDARRPYWMEPGVEQTFESNEALVLWGEEADGMNPAEVTLIWQGVEWKPAANRVVRITPQNGQRMLDSLATATGRTN